MRKLQSKKTIASIDKRVYFINIMVTLTPLPNFAKTVEIASKGHPIVLKTTNSQVVIY